MSPPKILIRVFFQPYSTILGPSDRARCVELRVHLVSHLPIVHPKSAAEGIDSINDEIFARNKIWWALWSKMILFLFNFTCQNNCSVSVPFISRMTAGRVLGSINQAEYIVTQFWMIDISSIGSEKPCPTVSIIHHTWAGETSNSLESGHVELFGTRQRAISETTIFLIFNGNLLIMLVSVRKAH